MTAESAEADRLGPIHNRSQSAPDPDPGGVVEIRPESVGDHEAIREVAAAFGSDAEADLVERIRDSPEYEPSLALVAVVGGEVVGHVMISGAAIHGDAGERSIPMLSPLAVRPDRQRQGIGTSLVTAALDRADRRGEPLVVLQGDPGYYGRFGFEPAETRRLDMSLPEWAAPECAQVRLLSAYDPSDAGLRGRVVEPAAFDALE